ncbi:MAG: ABC transporter ATP-binding protein [Mycobacteriales bacterium]
MSGALGRLRGAVVGSPRVRVLRMLAAASPGLMAAAVAFALVEAVVPNVALIALGRMTGEIPAAVSDGLGSPAGHRLLVQLSVGGALYTLSLLRSPVQDVLTTMTQARMTATSQRRLIEAVSTPAGIAHLEDPAVLDRLSSATGELASAEPSGAPMMLLARIGNRLSGLLACLVLASFRWWLGLALFATWVVLGRPLRTLVRARVTTFRRATEPLRRSWYFLGLAWRPPAAKEIRVFGLGDWLIGNHRTLYESAMEPSWREIRRLNRRLLLLSGLVLTAYGVACGTLGWAAYHGTVRLGVLVTMLTMLPASMQVGSVSLADFQLESMLSAIPDLDALTAELADPGATRPTTSLAKRTEVAGMPRREVRFEAVSFRYPGGDHDVLSGLDLVLEAGRSTALVGVNGAGKTTLITLLARLREPTGGRITVDGVPLADLPAATWQRQVAAVFQDFARLPLTVRENVALDLLGGPADPDALASAARRAGMTDLVAGLPRGWDTILSAQYEGGQDLSGGQWQRVALARALYAVERGATILVMDEPTAQLDVRAEARFYDHFLDITAGVTSLVISHRFSTLRRADRIAVLDGGRITELGSHDELVSAGGEYARMFTLQAARFDTDRKPGRKAAPA